jgi:hypothetical protein
MTVERAHVRLFSKSISRISLEDPSKGCILIPIDVFTLLMLVSGVYGGLWGGSVISLTYTIVTKALAVPASDLQEDLITHHIFRPNDTQSPRIVVEGLSLLLLIVSCYESHKTNALIQPGFVIGSTLYDRSVRDSEDLKKHGRIRLLGIVFEKSDLSASQSII